MAFVRLILLLGICVTSFITIECQVCTNGAGYCDYSTSYLHCYINNSDTQSIKVLLTNCASYSSSFSQMYVHKNYVSNEHANLLVDIEFPSNIQSLYIHNNRDQDHIRLTTSSHNTGLTRIDTYAYIELESNDFFTHFTGLQQIYMRYVLSREPPSFTNLNDLTYLRLYLVGPVIHTLDEGIVSELTNLVYLSLPDSYFKGIAKGAFRSMNKLTFLYLRNNELAYIEDGALSELSSLKEFYLHENELVSVSDNVFEGLTDLTYLYLDNNPGFPLNALIQARSVVYLYLRYNGYHTLDPYVFQQMDSLNYLYLSDPFICDCKLQWISLVNQYQLYFRSGVCSEPVDPFSRSITTQSLYTNCSQKESFQCFNKSITCPNSQVCHNTETGYFCGCPIGYAQYSSGECKDVNECDEATDCQHTCVNTEGSFHCTCNEGYELASDGYSCDDVNECLDLNGGCEFGCLNNIGSYQCQCHYGLELINKTHCDTEIQCNVVQYIENEDYRYSCNGGYNLTITNFTLCHNEDYLKCCEGFNLTINDLKDENSTNELQMSTIILILLIVTIFINVVLVVIIILILLCTFKKRQSVMNPKHSNVRNIDIPLKDIIENKSSITPYAIMENSDAVEDNTAYENMK